MKKFTSIILCLVLLFSITACGANPTPAPEPVKDAYTQAAEALSSRSDVTLDLVITTLTTVAGDEFSQQSTQTLTYQGKGTQDAIISMAEQVEYSIHDPADEPEEESEPVSYEEIWAKDTVYAQLDENYCFRAELTAEDANARYIPVALFDPALYGNIATEETETGSTVRFTQPTAGEAWAVPQDAQLVEASGTATINTENVLTEMHYTVTYTYGSASITKTVQSKPLALAITVSAPEDPDSYTAITHIDALQEVIASSAMLAQADSIAITSASSLTSQAAGLVQNQSVQGNLHGRKGDTLAKIKTSQYALYYDGEEYRYELEEVYQDGKVTTTEDKGLPYTVSISWKDMRDYFAGLMLASTLVPDYWQDAAITDLGSLYMIEYELNDNFGNIRQNEICQQLWNDSAFLLDMSSAYKNKDLTGYLSIDKYTGLPVATGYYYEGVHTIDGTDYALSLQYDQSFEAPALGAYKEITGELPPEEAPENKPTPVFYHVTGDDGQEMWLFGTIHVGDERTAYLPQAIRDAFEASDALALECDTEAFDKQVEEDEELSQQVSDLYFYSGGLNVIKHSMEDEAYEYTEKLLKAVGGYNMNMPYTKPYVWSSAIEQFYLRQGYQLHQDQGVEERLTAWAHELDKPIWEIESSLEQIRMLTSFSKDLQLWMLEDAASLIAEEYWTDTMELYALWCAGDEAALREELASEWNTEEMTEEEIAKYTPLREEYIKAMDHDRNEGMLETAIEYLESGKVVFYAVGLAHLLDNTNGLVDTLRDAGYTVELVSFAN